MNNKKGGVGAKIILVLILMIASAVGGAYGYRVLDGKLAVRDAQKDIEAIRVTDYDTAEATEVQGLIDNVKKDLETATTRKEVYELMQDFNTNIDKVQTKAEKELEEARREAEEARNRNNNNNNNNDYNNNNNNNNNGNNGNGYSDDNGDYDSDSNDNYNNNNNNNNGGSDNTEEVNNNGNDNAITNDDGTSGRTGLFGSLLGGNDN